MTIANVLTVDLEDWYQGLEIERAQWGAFEARIWTGCTRLLALLDEAGVRATFYTLSDIAERHPDLVEEIARRGHEIGTHGESHAFVYRQTPDVLRAELRRSIEILGKLTGQPVVSHRAPFFSITKEALWALDVLTELGIRCDSSIMPVHNYRYGIPDAPTRPWRYRGPSGAELVEFPVSTVKMFGHNVPAAGGAYFRLYPYALTRALMRSVNRAGWPVMFYIHPWELDPDQPRADLPWRIRTTHYHNLRGTEPRIRRLLRDFTFAPLRDVLASLETQQMIGASPAMCRP
jgi:polysaccharide deacetylase family protein (PEP-CTERM system associated)